MKIVYRNATRIGQIDVLLPTPWIVGARRAPQNVV